MIGHLSLLASVSIDVDATAVIQGFLFVALWAVLGPLIIKPYLEARDAREEGIDGSKEEARDFEARANAAIAEYEEKLRDARREAQDIRETLKNQGAAEQRDILEEEREKLHAKLTQERTKLEAEIEAAQKEIDARAKGLSASMVEKLLPAA